MTRPAHYGCNDNQNYFVEGGKTTSRVLQQPGGASSISLGWEEPKKITPPQKKEVNEIKEQRQNTNQKPTSEKATNERVSSNSFASGSNMNSGNVITDRPTSRVLNPPGGKSSFTLG